jgi:hypothetical protein
MSTTFTFVLQVFERVPASPPLDVSQGSPLDPIDVLLLNGKVNQFHQNLQAAAPEDRANISKKGVELICAGNIFWLDWQKAAAPGVPVNRTGVRYLMDYFFKKPSRMDLTVGVSSVLAPSLPLQGLQLLSPEENLHAMIMAIGRDIRCGVSDDILLTWREMCLSCT